MRIPIRAQLSLLVLFCALSALMVLALATWFQARDFITAIRLSGLSLTASLKAAQISSTILLYESQVRSVSTRILIQSALDRYRNGNTTNENWVRTQSDISGALANGQILLQAIIYPAFDVGNTSALNGLANVTADNLNNAFLLPYNNSDGSPVYLGNPGLGYPPILYPNLTYHNATSSSLYYVTADGGQRLDPDGILVNGPLITDNGTALISCTTAIINNTSFTDILGWMTVIVNGSMLFNVRDSQEGLGRTGQVLIVGPDTRDNLFDFNVRGSRNTSALQGQRVKFILPPSSNSTLIARHNRRSSPFTASDSFLASDFPAVQAAWTADNKNFNNAGSMLDTKNEQNFRVSVGYAQVATPLVDWILIDEQSYGETVEPIDHLRDIVLICVFSVTGGLLLISFPVAHYSVAPIRALRAATRKSVDPYLPDDSQSTYSTSSTNLHDGGRIDEDEARKEGFFSAMTTWATSGKDRDLSPRSHDHNRKFRIPMKVPERKHLIYDELTDLTTKFNEMSDELTMQYHRLEERVRERTAELEKSKKAAEAANQSKTLFIANISHELKTPLNGILGLTQICMNEDDPLKIRSTLRTVYQSGDLLLHLLTDLLTFSKNEVGQQLSIDESEFRLSDLGKQLVPTFDRQAKEAQINLQVSYVGTNDSLGNSDGDTDKAYGPLGTGRVKDMYLWGDKNRILQVLMNFTSNSLKFTPPQGSVTVTIRCCGLTEVQVQSRTGSVRKSSMVSRRSKTSKVSHNSSRKRVRTSDTSLMGTSDSENDKTPNNQRSRVTKREGKLNIHVGGETTQIDRIVERRRSKSPPPLNTRDLDFEFEVEDTGPGIPEDQQKKIFEPFVQGDLGLSKKYGGTGLGLSICAQLASLMGGELALESTVGKGSKFTMRIPLRYLAERAGSLDSGPNGSRTNSISDAGKLEKMAASAPDNAEPLAYSEVPRVLGLSQPFVAKEVAQVHSPKADLNMMKKAESEAAQQGSKVRVLVAEDNKINQEVVLRMLKLEDVYDVTIAKDGQEAYDKVREAMDIGKNFHLVFMDVQMPNVDGIQSTKMIRSMGFSSPIVALTAFAEKSNEDECMASGMDYFLAKPIRRPALKQVLKKYCATIPEEPETTTITPLMMNGDVTTSKKVSHAEVIAQESDTSNHPSPELPSSSASAEDKLVNGSIKKTS